MKFLALGFLALVYLSLPCRTVFSNEKVGPKAEVDLSLVNVGSVVPVTFGGFLPGKSAIFTLIINNKTGGDLTIDKLTVSCGCMVPPDTVAELVAGGSREIPIKLNVEPLDGLQKRSLRISDSMGRYWVVGMTFDVVLPLTIESNKFTFTGSNNKPETFKLTLGLKPGFDHIPGFRKSELTCKAAGTTILSTDLRKSTEHEGWDLTLSASTRYMGLSKSTVDNIVMTSDHFQVSIPLQFTLDRPIRFSPAELSRLKIGQGTQRIMVYHDLQDYEVEFVAEDREGKSLEIVASTILSNSKVSAFILSSPSSEAISRVGLGSKRDSTLPKISIPVSD
ncbi:MAG: hypothetical protein MUC83_08580 [Pirellula sp.]|nr:hypothetical protein [Pirellula sp.]